MRIVGDDFSSMGGLGGRGQNTPQRARRRGDTVSEKTGLELDTEIDFIDIL